MKNSALKAFSINSENDRRKVMTLELSDRVFLQTQFDIGIDSKRLAMNLINFGREIIREVDLSESRGEK